MAKLLYGDSAARLVSERIGAPETSITTLKQIPANKRVNGQVFQILTGDGQNTLWQWVDAATATGDDVLAITPSDAPSTGRFMRCPGAAMLAVTFFATTPSGTALLTVPSATILQPLDFGVRVSRRFTGVASALAGLSSSNHFGHTGIFGFIGSMVATNLDNAFSPTSAGTAITFQMAAVASGSFDTRVNSRQWMKGGDTFRQDGGGWGTGVGQWLISCNVLQNPGT